MYLTRRFGSFAAAALLSIAICPVITSAGPVTDDGTWRAIPPQFYGHEGVYDPVRERMLVFGGNVWSLTLSGIPAWHELSHAGATPLVSSAVYDSKRDRVVIFGGASGNEIWTLSLSGPPAWAQLPATGPAPSFAGDAVYDPLRDRMLVFSSTRDVFALSFSDGAWTKLSVTGSLVDRGGFTTVYDPSGDRVVIFGGQNDDYPNPNDVWALSLASTPAWTELMPAGATPPGRTGHTAIYDSKRDRMVICDGFNSDMFPLRDTWALSLAGTPAWAELQPGGTIPQSREFHSAIYDPVRDQMVIYGGENFRSRDDAFLDARTLRFASNEWAPVVAPPSQRASHAAIYDPVRDRMIVFGGRAKHHFSEDDGTLPAFQFGAQRWTTLAAGTGPDPSYAYHGIYDPVRDRMVVYGVDDGTVWALPLAARSTWTNITPSGAPHAGGAVIYDPVRDRLILFAMGTWALAFSGTPEWTQLKPKDGDEAQRYGASVIYDPVRDQMIVFGGFDGSVFHGDAVALSLSGTPQWHSLALAGNGPERRADASAIYDPVRDRMIVFGGWLARSDAWALSLSGTPAWTMLTPAGSTPQGRSSHSAVYDPTRDRMVVFGGEDYYSDFNDTWALEWGQVADTTPPTIHVELNHDVLWPPNHKMVSVCATVKVTDNADPASTFSLVSISVIDGKHAVSATDDIRGAEVGSADRCFDLRATRDGSGGGREYRIVYEARDASNNTARDTVSVRVPLSASHATTAAPTVTALSSVYPNPFNPRTTVAYSLEQAQHVTIAVYDVRGALVRALVDEATPAGEHRVSWDGTDHAGRAASSGIYFLRMTAGNYSETRKIVMLK